MKQETVWDVMKQAWEIKKKVIKDDLGINPNKPWDEITIQELGMIANYLEVTVSELIAYI